MQGLFIGGGAAAKEVFERLSQTSTNVVILGMTSQSNWLEAMGGVADYVNPADFKDIRRKLRKHEIDDLAFIGGPLVDVGPKDIARYAFTALRTLRRHPSLKALPNSFLHDVGDFLDERKVRRIHLRSLLPDIVKGPGSLCGEFDTSEAKRMLAKVEEDRCALPTFWQRQGAVIFSNGDVQKEASGTKNLVRAASEKFDMNGATLVKLAVPEFLELDSPVIDHELVSLCKKSGLSGIVAEAENCLIVQEAKIKEELQSSDFHITLV